MQNKNEPLTNNVPPICEFNCKDAAELRYLNAMALQERLDRLNLASHLDSAREHLLEAENLLLSGKLSDVAEDTVYSEWTVLDDVGGMAEHLIDLFFVATPIPLLEWDIDNADWIASLSASKH